MAPASTASSAVPFAANIFQASAFTGMPLSHVEITMGFIVPSKPLASDFFAASKGAVNAERCKNFLRFMFYGPTYPLPRGGKSRRLFRRLCNILLLLLCKTKLMIFKKYFKFFYSVKASPQGRI